MTIMTETVRNVVVMVTVSKNVQEKMKVTILALNVLKIMMATNVMKVL